MAIIVAQLVATHRPCTVNRLHRPKTSSPSKRQNTIAATHCRDTRTVQRPPL
jgi:hypothetical protein